MKSYENFKLLQEAIKLHWFVDCENGEVYNRKTGKLLVGSDSSGYIQIGTTVNGKRVAFYKHQIIACASGYELFGYDVNHINGDKKDNRISNLEVITHKENTIHSAKFLRLTLQSLSKRENVPLTTLEQAKIEAEELFNEYKEKLIRLSINKGLSYETVRKLHKCS